MNTVKSTIHNELPQIAYEGGKNDAATITESSTIDELVQEYLKSVILASIIPPHVEWEKVSKHQIHSRTAENYIFLLKKHFLQQFSGCLIYSINTWELQNHFFCLSQRYSNSLLIKVHFLLYRMYRRAHIKWGINNPLNSDDFRLPASMKKDRKIEPYNE